MSGEEASDTTFDAEEALTAALKQLRQRISDGDAAGALDHWEHILEVQNLRYLDAVTAKDWREAYGAALAFIAATGNLIPRNDSGALGMIRVFINMLFDAANGKTLHPILLYRGHIPGLMGDGTADKENAAAAARACWDYLEGWGHNAPAKEVADALSAAGYDVSPSTVRSWRKRESGRPIICRSKPEILAALQVSGARNLAEAISVVHKYLARVIDSRPLLRG